MPELQRKSDKPKPDSPLHIAQSTHILMAYEDPRIKEIALALIHLLQEDAETRCPKTRQLRIVVCESCLEVLDDGGKIITKGMLKDSGVLEQLDVIKAQCLDCITP